MKRLIILAIILVAVIVPASALAQTPIESGIDFLFIVDQSGSVSQGHVIEDTCAPQCRGPATDPDGLAIQALHVGLDPLFARLLSRQVSRGSSDLQPEVNRVGVILFGSSAISAVDLTPIQAITTTSGQLEANITDQLPKAPINMGDTSFGSAFAEACRMLVCDKALPAQRRRVLILLTDGAPVDDLIGRDITGQEYYARLRRQTPTLFDDPQTTLWVLGVDQQGQFWPSNEPYWATLAPGRTRLIRDPRGISRTFHMIAEQSIGQIGIPGRCDGSTLDVSPYLASIYLALNYENPDTSAEFLLPSGTVLEPHSPSVLSYSRTALSESFTVKNPEAGQWRCRSIGGTVIAEYKTIEGAFKVASVQALSPGGDMLLSPCKPFNLAVQYLDIDQHPLRELPDFPLQQQAVLHMEGHNEQRTMILDGAANDRWITQEPITPTVAGGQYPIDFTVQLEDGPTIYTGTTTFAVSTILPCLELIAPSDERPIPLHTGLSDVPVSVEVKATQGGIARYPSGVFRENLDSLVAGHVDFPNGTSQAFQLSPTTDAGVYSAELASLRSEGIYTVTIALRGTTPEGHRYSTDPIVFRVERTETLGYRVFLHVLLAGRLMLIAGLVGFLIWFIYQTIPPYPRGVVVIEERDDDGSYRTVGSYAMGRQKRWRMFRVKHPIARGTAAPRSAGIEKIAFRRIARRNTEGLSVTAVGPHKKPVVDGSFYTDGQSKIFGRYRIRYQK